MPLEAATTISDLVVTNPPGTDAKKQGDDHLRLIKSVLKYCFPNATKKFYMPTAKAKSADYTVLAEDDNCTIVCDTTTPFSLTLPNGLGVSDAGWSCFVLKTSSDANPVYLVPPSGTINGFSKVRRAVPYNRITVYWTGSTFVASRVWGVPIGSRIPFHGGTLVQGCLWPDGATFIAADYVELALVLGGNVKPDSRGRVGFDHPIMGIGNSGVLTQAYYGNIIAVNTQGGLESAAIAKTNLPNIQLDVTGDVTIDTLGDLLGSTGLQHPAGDAGGRLGSPVSPTPVGHFSNGKTAALGDGASMSRIPPAIIQYSMLVTE